MTLIVEKQRSQSVRVNAMRIAHSLANFDVAGFRDLEDLKSRGLKARYEAAPNPRDWPFIDLDPLLGSVDEFLIDDGARATWPVDHAFCMPLGDSIRDWRIFGGRTIDVREARRRQCRVFSPKMMHIDQVSFNDGRFDVGSANIALLNGRWADAHRGPVSSHKDMMGGRNGCSNVSGIEGDLIAGAALRIRYEWSAIFSFPNGLNLRFGTSAAGALAIFRDRERPDQQARRSPLLHWVRKHWRLGKTTADIAREVRAHLKGSEQIVWHGIPVAIIPAEFELERNIAA